MNINEILTEKWDDEDPNRDFPNPIPSDVNAKGLWDYADEVIGNLTNQYIKDNNISSSNKWGTYDPNVRKQITIGVTQKYANIMNVPIDRLIGTENHLVKSHVDKLVKSGDVDKFDYHPVIYKKGKTYIVADGNHRVAAGYLQGKKTIKAFVFDLDKLDKNNNKE